MFLDEEPRHDGRRLCWLAREMCADKPSTVTNPNWQTAKSEELDSINNVADSIHLELPERPEVFAEKSL
jgi:hypothetical protein